MNGRFRSWLLLTALGLVSAVACGARTELYGRELCGQKDLVRDCFNFCGQGTQVCDGSYWLDCEVEVTTRSCENDCGVGRQECIDDAWQACEVEVTARSCENDCGTGSQQCVDNEWQACEVEVTARSCENDCGTGSQQCVDNEWQTCEVAPVSRGCSNDCGDGQEECSDGVWGDCEVPEASRSCKNDCGSGSQTCTDGAWNECDVPVTTRECSSVCGTGKETCMGGSWQNCDAPQPKPPKLKSTIRDFNDTHPDFERDQGGGFDPGIVKDRLGSDEKPVYNGKPNTITTTGKEYFDQWYNDVKGVNMSAPLDLQLEAEAGESVFFVYDNTSFFPIDDQLLGNQGRPHNFHFTLEAETTFTYVGGEIFSFSGDDDMWVFINRRLAIDLGGLHASMTQSVDLDVSATDLKIELGGTYPIKFFFAERHTVASDFTIRTTVAEAGSCE